MLIWEESFVYVFLGMLTYIWVPARPTREMKDTAVEDSCGGSRDDPLGGVKSNCLTLSP